MIKSMTGYGRGQSRLNGTETVVEVRSVNHRYFEFSARYPRGCAFLEDKLKSLFSEGISRGKVDVFVTADLKSVAKTEIEINHELATAYVRAIKDIAGLYSLKDEISAVDLIKNQDILTIRKEAPDEDKLWESVRDAASKALEAFVSMRENEGKRLRDDVLLRAQKVMEGVSFIEQHSPKTVNAYRERLEARITELLSGAGIDEQRIITETAIFADKIAVAEETVRLRSHFEQLQELLSGSEPVGRKLDFLLQEFNREVNTIGSKAQDSAIAKTVVEIKAELEKIREQIQNIE